MALILAARIAHVGTFTLFGAVKWIGFVLCSKEGGTTHPLDLVFLPFLAF